MRTHLVLLVASLFLVIIPMCDGLAGWYVEYKGPISDTQSGVRREGPFATEATARLKMEEYKRRTPGGEQYYSVVSDGKGNSQSKSKIGASTSGQKTSGSTLDWDSWFPDPGEDDDIVARANRWYDEMKRNTNSTSGTSAPKPYTSTLEWHSWFPVPGEDDDFFARAERGHQKMHEKSAQLAEEQWQKGMAALAAGVGEGEESAESGARQKRKQPGNEDKDHLYDNPYAADAVDLRGLGDTVDPNVLKADDPVAPGGQPPSPPPSPVVDSEFQIEQSSLYSIESLKETLACLPQDASRAFAFEELPETKKAVAELVMGMVAGWAPDGAVGSAWGQEKLITIGGFFSSTKTAGMAVQSAVPLCKIASSLDFGVHLSLVGFAGWTDWQNIKGKEALKQGNADRDWDVGRQEWKKEAEAQKALEQNN